MTDTAFPRAGILHVDLDAFFASVEQLLDPRLRGRPVIVGGTGRRGVVAAASYEARRIGVHSAMPTARARVLCPEGVFLPPRHDLYRLYSRRVFEILRSYTPLVEPVSLDEAFLDVRGARLSASAEEVARRIRERVRDEVGLTASVGVATTKLVAKLAGEEAKPDGLMVVPPGAELAFLHPLPVGRLWGVGPATQAKLADLGVTTVGDLARVPQATLIHRLGEATGRHLHALAWNRDPRPVVPEHAVKSVSCEQTFPADLTDPGVLRREVARQAERVAARLREAGLSGRTVTVKVRFPDFRTVTRSVTLHEPTDAPGTLTSVAACLLERVEVGSGVRLLGVGVSNLTPAASRQDPLPFEEVARRERVAGALREVRSRFGPDALRPASALLDRESG